jgi:biotin carboxyl carrier protein
MSEHRTLIIDDTAYETRVTRKFARRKPYAPKDPKRVAAFIPGVIRALHVAPGDRVRKGQGLLVLEAMKMQNDVAAAEEATVKAVLVAPGDTVAKGQLLIEFE